MLQLGNIEKKQISAFCNSEKRGIAIHQTSPGVVSSKDADTIKTSDPLLPVENVNKDNDCVGEASLILRKNDNKMSTNPEVLSTPLAMTCETDLQSMVPRASASEDLTPNVGQCQQEVLESTEHKSIKSAEEVQAAEDILPESPHDPLMAQKLCAPENKLSEPNLKHEDSFDQLPTLGNLSRTLVIPEQTYIWQYVLSP